MQSNTLRSVWKRELLGHWYVPDADRLTTKATTLAKQNFIVDFSVQSSSTS